MNLFTAKIWRNASLKMFPYALVALVGATLVGYYGSHDPSALEHRLAVAGGVALFVLAAIAFLHVFTSAVHRLAVHHRLGESRAATLRFLLEVMGYVIIGLFTLSILHISIVNLLLGGAVIGIILGVAAQQVLANFFASLMLVAGHSIEVGRRIAIFSGGLGGEYAGTVVDIGLSHTKLLLDGGGTVLLPNSALLAGAAIVEAPPQPSPRRPPTSH